MKHGGAGLPRPSALRALLAAPAVLLALLAAGCARAPGPAAEPMLVRGGGAEPDTLDAQKARTVEAQTILRDLCEGLTTVARDGGVAPGLARQWHASSDGRTYTFALRPARWSNGDAISAADFVAALRRLVDPATASPYAQVVNVIAHAPEIISGHRPVADLGVSAPDAATVRVELGAPAPYLPALLSHPSTCPVHRPTLARYGAEFARPGIAVASGAFVLEEWVPGSHVRLTRNPLYWNAAANRVPAVEYEPIADENAELLRYRADELDVTAVIPRSQLDWIRAHVPRELHLSPQLTTYYYAFNLDRALWRDHPGLRRALSMVIDRERLASAVLRAGEQPAWGWVPPGIADYTPQSPDYRALAPAARLARARLLYAQAGYSASHPLRLELRYNSSELNDRIAVAVASMWKQALGAEVVLSAEEYKSLLQDIDRRDVDLFLSSWAADYNDAYTFAQVLSSDFGVNLTHYRSPVYDSLLTRAAAEVDSSRRRALLEQAERVALADQPLMPIYFYVNKHLVKPRVQGWYDDPLNVTYSKDLALAPVAQRR